MNRLLLAGGNITLVVFVVSVQGIRDHGKSGEDAFLPASSLNIIFSRHSRTIDGAPFYLGSAKAPLHAKGPKKL